MVEAKPIFLNQFFVIMPAQSNLRSCPQHTSDLICKNLGILYLLLINYNAERPPLKVVFVTIGDVSEELVCIRLLLSTKLPIICRILANGPVILGAIKLATVLGS